ncbi:NADPH-dependent 7-cyano-7-deazaguanine reductase QueF [Teredinibacter turnerae]|uniref:NADPH-dependent 7-cyano-7-deazaguanine reductase QueF n=1 Tax=Teredinibacter turnerae TaxID=2426 RepID=UPI00037DF71C|nr:NADPH-dependent 7-cyano-7-deazaguanine reductase QueF [Teredinibacter turnerae]
MSDHADTLLGKDTTYPEHYDPALLQPIPRERSRETMVCGDLPFTGVDIWTAYELSWLDSSGKPHVAVGEFWVPADSSAIIESKSLKYYLNSLNQHRFATREQARQAIAGDLSEAAGGEVQVTLFDIDDYSNVGTLPGTCVDTLDAPVYVYQPDASLLKFVDQPGEQQQLFSHLLKSNCPVTGQPDWATVWVQCSGLTLVPESFLAYVVSFRGHQDFHENCVERIFTDLMAGGKLQDLAVYARYTRRGGLDINPLRFSGVQDAEALEQLVSKRIARQ